MFSRLLIAPIAIAVAFTGLPRGRASAKGPEAPATEQPPSPSAGASPADGSLADAWDDALIEEATTHFREGQRLFDTGRYLQAAVEFERSSAAIRAGETLYNIALSYERAGRPADALIAALRYLALPDCAEDVDRLRCANKREEVQRTVDRLRDQVAELAVTVDPGVRVRGIRVDDRVLPVTDFPVLLEPGAIEVEILGMGPDERKLRVLRLEPGKTTLVRVEPFAAANEDRSNATPSSEDSRVDASGSSSVPRPFVPSPTDERRHERLRQGFWSGVALTGAASATVGILGGLTLLYQRRYSEALCRGMCADPNATYPRAERERFYDLKTGTNAMIGVTAGLAAVTLGLGIAAFWPRGAKTRVSTQARGLTLRF